MIGGFLLALKVLRVRVFSFLELLNAGFVERSALGGITGIDGRFAFAHVNFIQRAKIFFPMVVRTFFYAAFDAWIILVLHHHFLLSF